MPSLAEKHIVLGITGGIAAYKSAEIVRPLIEQGAVVQVVMTEAAKAFIAPLTLQALSGRPVRDSLLDPSAESGMGHIEIARWADQIVIAPASADFIARLAGGMASDLLTIYAERELAEGYAMGPDTKWQVELEDSFPYEETTDQISTLSEIISFPM